jgi:peptidoglycan/LPS O-acetylase OafA/YrhL
VPYELLCYLTITVLAFLGLKRWQWLAPALALVSTIGFVIVIGARHSWNSSAIFPAAVDWHRGVLLLWAYLWGVALYLYRDKVPWSWPLMMISVAVSAGALFVGGFLECLAPASLAYVTVFIGLTNAKRLKIVDGADYSYGFFLYHWVILQTVVNFAPHVWWATILIGFPIVIAFAAFSWHLVEKPALGLRHTIMSADKGAPNPALFLSGGIAAALLGFVICFKLYPLIVPR